MASLSATYTWAAYETAWRTRLGITTGREEELRALLSAAARAGDQYMANPFDGSDDLSPSNHPPEVWEGMVAWAQASLRLGQANAGLTGAMTGGLQEFYAQGLDPAKIRKEAVHPYWWPWCRRPWAV